MNWRKTKKIIKDEIYDFMKSTTERIVIILIAVFILATFSAIYTFLEIGITEGFGGAWIAVGLVLTICAIISIFLIRYAIKNSEKRKGKDKWLK